MLAASLDPHPGPGAGDEDAQADAVRLRLGEGRPRSARRRAPGRRRWATVLRAGVGEALVLPTAPARVPAGSEPPVNSETPASTQTTTRAPIIAAAQLGLRRSA